ncbi:class I SAM-dependent methyltransferase [Actinophytocola algeriensis]|uniref:SAM-dependent methyltransferase n=1 Tax=Actinophytocola algeriensis TaxID=1768010 RepID=A0A7W7Q187_9PSEU|nr:methyltransferase domain-containing protein [Actinophytocola algeriensis]MBB4905124.1 SAM-dependent methyltransferase [Actinophytocola algeriensis]MBE1473191.1 SAM-dependent methyltransferase [Actinophytocola algeriensis]
MRDVWAAGDEYEAYVGRWSRRVAERFVPWLGVPAGSRWLDVGCGTGALTAAAAAAGATVTGVDPSRGFVAGLRDVVVGDARALPFAGGRFDVVVSGLALNFVPDPALALAEQTRVTVPGATVAAYVWDYADGMAMMRLFWDAAREADPDAPDEGPRFPLCAPEPLAALWRAAGLTDVVVDGIEIPTTFTDFDDYWRPFLGGQGAAPAYLAAQPREVRDRIRDLLRARVPERDIQLTARAWAVCGTRP